MDGNAGEERVARRRSSPASGSARATSSISSSPPTRPRRYSGRRQAGAAVVGGARALLVVIARDARPSRSLAAIEWIARIARPAHERAQLGSDARRDCLCMSSILAFEKISKRFGAIVVADGIDLALARRRGARHHRAERRRQDHAVRHRDRHACRRTPGRVVLAGDDITRLPPERRCPWASRARSRFRSRSTA